MKKSTIWLLTLVMACTFIGLLYVQITYMENMKKMRADQFSEAVMRSLYEVTNRLEQDETVYYLEQDLDESSFSLNSNNTKSLQQTEATATHTPTSDGTLTKNFTSLNSNHPLGLGNRVLSDNKYVRKQEILKKQYQYQRGLLNEVILNILSQSSDRAITERADSTRVRRYLKEELQNSGFELPFEFAILDNSKKSVYHTGEQNITITAENYANTLFPNDPVNKQHTLVVVFPTKDQYILSSITYMIPSFAFTFILLFIFIYTIITVFRQKKLTEIKNDFINNMTHELKTPISTISLAAQMLSDDTVLKSPNMLKHVSTVINDETKRLRFQVEKVLQMSMFERDSAALRIVDIDANATIQKVADTYKLKVQNYGGKLTVNLHAEDSRVSVDEMHFTNVIFNLLDNAIKYRQEDVEPQLIITTSNSNDATLMISIKDNGIGIKREDLKRVFDKFYRVPTGNRHDVKGFGLGLAYVHKMVGLFHGSIHVESELKKGSDFIIKLPILK